MFFKLDPNMCEFTWDQILCWPETFVNRTVSIPCPNYVNKFNKKSKI